MTRARRAIPVPPRRSKYRAVPTEYKGVRYASKAEARRAAELDLLVRAGEVRWWIGQPTFRLGVAENVYRPDFLVVTPRGVHVEDIKGVETPKFRRDKRLWEVYGPCELHVLHKNGREIVTGRNRSTLI